MRLVRTSLAIIVVVVLALPLPIDGQTRDSIPDSEPERVQAPVSPWAAGVMELMVPTTGFAYAGDWSRGLLPNAVRVVGIAAMATSLSQGAPVHEGRFWGGYAAYLGGTVWAIVDVVRTAREKNRDTGAAAWKLGITPSPDGSIHFGVQFAAGQTRPCHGCR